MGLLLVLSCNEYRVRFAISPIHLVNTRRDWRSCYYDPNIRSCICFSSRSVCLYYLHDQDDGPGNQYGRFTWTLNSYLVRSCIPSDHPHFPPSLYFWPSHLHGRQTLVDFTHSFVRLREYMPHVRQYPYVSRIPVRYNFMWISAYSLETEQPFEYSCSWMECWYEHVCGPIPLRTSRGYFLQTLGNHTQAGWQLSDCYTHIVKIP